ncbi:MAG: L-threonylcarbamoyladenylate synthase [Myxococcota bacterium]
MRLTLHPEYPQPRKLEQVVDFIRRGEVVAYPTDTGYALGCDMNQRKAVEHLFRFTQRPKNKPGTLLSANFKQVSQFCYISDHAYRVVRRVLPGPYTLILEATKAVPRHLRGKRKEVGIRIPDNPVALALLEQWGSPFLNVTAYNFSEQYLDDPLDIERFYGKQLGCIVDVDLVTEKPSTIVDLTQNPPEVLREGTGDPEVFF